jgi:hypothetical protein
VLVRTASAVAGKQCGAPGGEFREISNCVLVLVEGGALRVVSQLRQRCPEHLQKQFAMGTRQGLAHGWRAMGALQAPVNIAAIGLPQPRNVGQPAPDGG